MVETTTTTKEQKKHSQQTITYWQWYNVSRNFFRRRASWTLGISKQLPDIEQQRVYHWF